MGFSYEYPHLELGVIQDIAFDLDQARVSSLMCKGGGGEQEEVYNQTCLSIHDLVDGDGTDTEWKARLVRPSQSHWTSLIRITFFPDGSFLWILSSFFLSSSDIDA